MEIKNNNNIILLSKDAMGKFYLPIYGNKYWKTPNIDELARRGTVFYRHYTTAPSTAMACFSMFTGVYPYKTNRKDYIPITNPEPYETLFDKMHSLGFECHIIWDEKWMTIAKPYSECYGSHVTFNSIKGIRQPVGTHQQHKKPLQCDEDKVEVTFQKIKSQLDNIMHSKKKIFLWMHLPHVHYGRNGYGSDIDVFDRIVGLVRTYFDDDNIFITSDHGNMNGSHDKIGYGFDVYEPAISIPFITPRLEGLERVDFLTSNCDLFDIISNRKIPRREFVYSDSAYYCQIHRKLAIMYGNYKYIYNRREKTEELYDVIYDPNENVNLISDRKNDIDRHASCLTQELYYYNSWDELPEIRKKMREEFKKIWREGTIYDKLHAYYVHIGKNTWRYIRNCFHLEISIHK